MTIDWNAMLEKCERERNERIRHALRKLGERAWTLRGEGYSFIELAQAAQALAVDLTAMAMGAHES